MRNDLETREIADAELDAVSGGVAYVSGGLAGAVSNDVTNAVNSSQTAGFLQASAAEFPAEASRYSGVYADGQV